MRVFQRPKLKTLQRKNNNTLAKNNNLRPQRAPTNNNTIAKNNNLRPQAQVRVRNYLLTGTTETQERALSSLKRLTVNDRTNLLAKMKKMYYDVELAPLWASRWNTLIGRVSRISGFTNNRKYNNNNNNNNNNNGFNSNERNRLIEKGRRETLERLHKNYNIRKPIKNNMRPPNGTSFERSIRRMSNSI